MRGVACTLHVCEEHSPPIIMQFCLPLFAHIHSVHAYTQVQARGVACTLHVCEEHSPPIIMQFCPPLSAHYSVRAYTQAQARGVFRTIHVRRAVISASHHHGVGRRGEGEKLRQGGSP